MASSCVHFLLSQPQSACLGSPLGLDLSASKSWLKKFALKAHAALRPGLNRSSCLTCEASVSFVAPAFTASLTRVMNVSHVFRSEERRVGKECGFVWRTLS